MKAGGCAAVTLLTRRSQLLANALPAREMGGGQVKQSLRAKGKQGLK